MNYDPLVVQDCGVLDGYCDCPRNPNGGVPETCKYGSKPVTAETIKTVDLNRRPALKEELEK